MATSGTTTFISYLRRMVLRVDGAGMTDGQLLQEFVVRRDEAAFESLVRRHGPMVLGVCHRILRDPHDAEDAFQSTFLVLARKAASVSPREMVGNWLYGVARTTAVRLRAANAKRRGRERQVADMPEPQTLQDDLRDDLHQLLDEELARLPEKFRVPIVLCDLEARTRREVARQFNIPEGTLSSRLTKARRMLAKRLARHGLAVAGGVLALSPSATSACLSVSLVSSTVKAALLAAAGQAATGPISVQVAVLTEGVLKAMFLTKVKTVVGVMLVIASLGGAAGLIYQTRAAEQREATKTTEKADQEKQPTVKNKENPKPDKQQTPKDDLHAIRGVWWGISVQRGDKEETVEGATLEGSRWHIHAESLDLRTKDGVMVGLHYKLDPLRSPKRLDLKVLGRLIPATYALDGDILKIRISHTKDGRQTSFTSKEGSDCILLTLRRQNSEDEEKKTGREPKKDAPAGEKTDDSVGFIPIKIGPEEYQPLFIKMLGQVAKHFEQIIYANQYDGRMEAYKSGLLTSRDSVRQYGIVQHAFVRFDTRDGGYIIAVRINKVRMGGTKSEEVVGRNTELERAILKELNAHPVPKDSLHPEAPPARPKESEED